MRIKAGNQRMKDADQLRIAGENCTFLFCHKLYIFNLTLTLGAQAKNIPFILRIISPKYFNATKGLRLLESNRILNTDDTGFQEITNIFFDVLRERNPPEVVSRVSVSQIRRGNAELRIGTNRAREIIPIIFELSNRQSANWDLNFLLAKINQLEKGSFFKYALFVFLFGMILQIIGFFLF